MIEVRGENLLITSSKVLVTHQVNQAVVDLGTMVEEERTTWSKLVEEKEALVLPKDSMISLHCFFLQTQMLLQESLFGKSDSVNSLKLFV